MIQENVNFKSESEAVSSHRSGVNRKDRSLSQDAQLQHSRRLDWRFLLANPNLESVAYLGTRCETLLSSLQVFSESLTIFDESRIDPGDASHFDIVVAIDPSNELVCEAARILKPDGALYVEVRRRLGLNRLFDHLIARTTKKSWQPVFYSKYLALIEHLGFKEVQLNWHWPNFESCTKIIPLNDNAALNYAFSQGGQGRQARLRATMGGWLTRSGLIDWTIRCISVVALRRVD